MRTQSIPARKTALPAKFTAALAAAAGTVGLAVFAPATASALSPAAVINQGVTTAAETVDTGSSGTANSAVADTEAHSFLYADPANRYIVVLGARLDAAGTMPEVLNARLDKAAAIARVHPGTKVIVTGGPTQTLPYTEAQAMQVGLALRGVNPFDVITENAAMSTVGNAHNVADILAARGATGAVLVSSASHIPRALGDFESALPGMPFVTVGVPGW